MKYLIMLSLLILPAFSQTTTVTITVTVPTAAIPVVTDWIATQCATYQADGVTCATFQYASLKDLLAQLTQQWGGWLACCAPHLPDFHPPTDSTVGNDNLVSFYNTARKSVPAVLTTLPVTD